MEGIPPPKPKFRKAPRKFKLTQRDPNAHRKFLAKLPRPDKQGSTQMQEQLHAAWARESSAISAKCALEREEKQNRETAKIRKENETMRKLCKCSHHYLLERGVAGKQTQNAGSSQHMRLGLLQLLEHIVRGWLNFHKARTLGQYSWNGGIVSTIGCNDC